MAYFKSMLGYDSVLHGIRGRDSVTVALLLENTHARAQRRIVERAVALGWRIVDLRFYGRDFPADLSPDGALIERI